jgi:hypothetical protein
MTISRIVAAGTSVPLSGMDTDITKRQKLTSHCPSLSDFFMNVTEQICHVTNVSNVLLEE